MNKAIKMRKFNFQSNMGLTKCEWERGKLYGEYEHWNSGG